MRYSGSVLTIAFAVAMFSFGSSDRWILAQDQKSDRDPKTEKHAQVDKTVDVEKVISKALGELAAEDQKLAVAQRFCPMMVHSRLGSMGTPIKVMINGKPVFVCCEECVDEASEHGDKTLETAAKLTKASAELAKLSAEDRTSAEAQKYCVVAEGSLLGGMGPPVKLMIDKHPVFLCCKGCTSKANADPKTTLKNVANLIEAGKSKDHDHHHDDQ